MSLFMIACLSAHTIDSRLDSHHTKNEVANQLILIHPTQSAITDLKTKGQFIGHVSAEQEAIWKPTKAEYFMAEEGVWIPMDATTLSYDNRDLADRWREL